MWRRVCGVVHYYWLVKSDVRKPVFYGVILGILLLWRLGETGCSNAGAQTLAYKSWKVK